MKVYIIQIELGFGEFGHHIDSSDSTMHWWGNGYRSSWRVL